MHDKKKNEPIALHAAGFIRLLIDAMPLLVSCCKEHHEDIVATHDNALHAINDKELCCVPVFEPYPPKRNEVDDYQKNVG